VPAGCSPIASRGLRSQRSVVAESRSTLAPMMASASRIFAAIPLILAGLYRWTPLKDVCISRCKAPLGFLLSRGGLQPGSPHRQDLRRGHGGVALHAVRSRCHPVFEIEYCGALPAAAISHARFACTKFAPTAVLPFESQNLGCYVVERTRLKR
jgi:predicted metal-binding integral membrane protein DUF2182